MVYKSPKAASLYSEFANSKNLKEAKIMPGTLTFSVVNWKESLYFKTTAKIAEPQ